MITDDDVDGKVVVNEINGAIFGPVNGHMIMRIVHVLLVQHTSFSSTTGALRPRRAIACIKPE